MWAIICYLIFNVVNHNIFVLILASVGFNVFKGIFGMEYVLIYFILVVDFIFIGYVCLNDSEENLNAKTHEKGDDTYGKENPNNISLELYVSAQLSYKVSASQNNNNKFN